MSAPVTPDGPLPGTWSALGMVIDGEPVTGTGPVSAVRSPATGEVLAELAAAGPEDVDGAVRAARRAHERAWGRLTGAQRAHHLYRLADVVERRLTDLAGLEALDAGTPVRHTRATGVPAAAATLRHHAGWADKLAHVGLGPGPDGAGPRSRGVAAVVVSSSSSLLATVGLLAPALACGNTVVVKPSEAAPLTTLLLVAAAHEAGLPPGVVNVLVGDAGVGSTLMAHPGVDAVGLAATGSLGHGVARALVGRPTPLTRHPVRASVAVVAADAPLDAVAAGVLDAMGSARVRQATTGTVVLVDEEVADALATRLRAGLAGLVVGDPTDTATDLGPCSSVAQRDEVTELVVAAELAGARRWAAPHDLPAAGAWLAPTLLTGTTPGTQVGTRELLGPVLVLVPVAGTGTAAGALRRLPVDSAVDAWAADAPTGVALAARCGAAAVRLRGPARGAVPGDDDRADPVVARGPAGLVGWLGA
ncbi:aldehyde dehydrogenase family protein [Rhodococcus aerolatus]